MKNLILALIFTCIGLNSVSANLKDTVVLEKYENGSVKKNYTILPEGYKVVSYYQDGSVSETGYFNTNKEKTGEWISYHNNGQVSAKANFKNDKKDGLWEMYDFNGKLFMVINYVNGKLKYAFTAKQDGSLIARQ